MIYVSEVISVIVPIYNKSRYLHECIESIIHQTYENLEIILVNDGSTDESLSICRYYENMDERVVVIDMRNSGVSQARNAGLRIAKGNYIGFVDADDTIDKNMYYDLYKQITNDKSDICTMVRYTIRNRDTSVDIFNSKVISVSQALRQLLLLKYPSSMCVSLFSREVIDKCESDPDIHFFEDFEHHFRILLNANKISTSTQMLYNYRINEGSVNKTGVSKKRITCLGIYDKIVPELNDRQIDLICHAQFFRAHALISVIASVAKTKKPDNKYYLIVKQHARLMFKDIIRSKYVPINYILAIGWCALAPRMFCELLKLKYTAQSLVTE